MLLKSSSNQSNRKTQNPDWIIATAIFPLDGNASFSRQVEIKLWCCYQHHVVRKNMGNGFGSSQEPEAQHGWKSWCIIDTHNLPGTAVLVRRHDQDSSNSSSPANRSFGPDELPGHGWRQPREQLCSTTPSEKQTFQEDYRPTEALADPWWKWHLGTCSVNTLFFHPTATLRGWTHPHQPLYHHTLTETVSVTVFMCIHPQMQRGVFCTCLYNIKSRSKIEFSAKNKIFIFGLYSYHDSPTLDTTLSFPWRAACL